MGEILDKPKSKLKDFFSNSKKLIQPPKELPEIKAQPKTQLPEIPLVPPKPALKEAPNVQELPKKEFKLPKIEPPHHIIKEQFSQSAQPPRTIKAHDDDLKRFEEAINNININMIHREAPEEADASEAYSQEEHKYKEYKGSSYYKPSKIGEGYFSEIEHYIKNHDINHIIDDILNKDFLTNMKDYHETKAQGKPFFLHKEDLKNKLANKMEGLRRLEEEWHNIRARMEEEEHRKQSLEHEIDGQSQELKAIFRQIKISQILDQEVLKEHYFKLRNGQELRCLNDLRKALSYLSDEDFNHHVNAERNDFAAWTREALQNSDIAEKIRNAKTRQELQNLLQNPI